MFPGEPIANLVPYTSFKASAPILLIWNKSLKSKGNSSVYAHGTNLCIGIDRKKFIKEYICVLLAIKWQSKIRSL